MNDVDIRVRDLSEIEEEEEEGRLMASDFPGKILRCCVRISRRLSRQVFQKD